jgi:hypothetical protein
MTAACVDNHLYPVVDGAAADSATDAGSDTDMDVSALVRFPVVLPDGAEEPDFFIYGETNSLGFQGQWFGTCKADSTIEITNSGGGTVCATGTVAGVAEGNWSSALLGILLCFSDGEDNPPWQTYPLAECPLTPGLHQRMAGASFEMEGALPGDLLEFHPKEDGEDNPPYMKVEPGKKDYLFRDLLLRNGRAPLDRSRMIALQFNISNTDPTAVPFDFCIAGLELLLLPE